MVKNRFPLGKLVATSGIDSLCRDTQFGDSLINALDNHASAQWGDICEEDRELNDMALKNKNGRLFSVYTIEKTKIWIITEHDYSATTVLLPEEY
jgi:hypothetical protein